MNLDGVGVGLARELGLVLECSGCIELVHHNFNELDLVGRRELLVEQKCRQLSLVVDGVRPREREVGVTENAE